MGLTVEVVQQGLLEHRAHEQVYLSRLQPWSQADVGEKTVRHTGRQMDGQMDGGWVGSRGTWVERGRSTRSWVQVEPSYPEPQGEVWRQALTG